MIWANPVSSDLRCEELQLIDRCHQIEPRAATPEEILLKHTQDQYDILMSTENETDQEKLEELSSHYDSIFIHPVSQMSIFALNFDVIICENVLISFIGI